MSENLPEIKIESIVELAKEYLPKMESGSAKAVAAMQKITAIADEEDYESVNNLLVRVRDAYAKINAYRTEITGPLDQLKKKFMEYEKPLSDKETSSEYNRLRALMTSYRNAEIEKKKKLEADAAKKKERENHLVDIGTAVLTKLNDLVLFKTKNADTASDAYFKKSTLEDWDKRAEVYCKMKPTLKPEEYNACFEVTRRFDLWNEEEWVDIINTIKKVETIEKWNVEVVAAATPVLNEWKAKIPELKENLIKLKNASDESERKRLADEQEAKAREDKERRDKELEQQHLDKGADISAQASLEKLNNEFVQQATVQQAGDTGPVKYVMKFTDPKKTVKALSTIIYHCMAHKDFPGIVKRDAKKKIVLDAQDRPEYIEPVQWWVKFFMDNCDADIDGTEVYEVAKLIIRK